MMELLKEKAQKSGDKVTFLNMESTKNDMEIKGITADSRKVKNGWLFAVLKGSKDKGNIYIESALKEGAAIILSDTPIEYSNIPQIQSSNPRRTFAQIAALFYKKQPQTCIAVTGTNGKSSIVHFTKELWENIGLKAASLGTLGQQATGLPNVESLSTPAPSALHKMLSDVANEGIEHLALEASSHGLDQHRLSGVTLTAAAFTNLTRDHLDYHGDMPHYLKSKLKLFTEILPENGTAILNADEDSFRDFQKAALSRGQKIISYGYKSDDIKILKTTPLAEGMKIELSVYGEKYQLKTSLIGSFQAHNAAAALGLVLADIDKSQYEDAIKAIEKLTSVSGRMEKAVTAPNGAIAYIDYAHTDAAMQSAMKALRPHCPKRLICVFGAGGNRDKGKRPLMGKAAIDCADYVIITDDNSRDEEPAQIRKDILKGCDVENNSHRIIEVDGRANGIKAAFKEAQPEDVIFIAGKGHETSLMIKGVKHEFDDRIEAIKAAKEMP